MREMDNQRVRGDGRSKKAEGIHTLEVVFKETTPLPRDTTTLYQSPKEGNMYKGSSPAGSPYKMPNGCHLR